MKKFILFLFIFSSVHAQNVEDMTEAERQAESELIRIQIEQVERNYIKSLDECMYDEPKKAIACGTLAIIHLNCLMDGMYEEGSILDLRYKCFKLIGQGIK